MTDGIKSLVDVVVNNWGFWKWFFIALTVQYFGRGFFGFIKGLYVVFMFFRKDRDKL